MGRTSTVYLVHFETPYKHAKHYMDSAAATWNGGSRTGRKRRGSARSVGNRGRGNSRPSPLRQEDDDDDG